MRLAAARFSLLSGLLAIAACTQAPAKVELNGQKTYARDGVKTYAANPKPVAYHDAVPRVFTIANEPTQTTAPVASIGTADLPSLTKNASPQHVNSTEVATLKPPMAEKKQGMVLAGQPASMASAGLLWPVASKKVVSEFGPKGGGIANDGINIAASEGEPVWAADGGEVIYVGSGLKDYGNMVIIKHAGGKTTTYAHMSRIIADKYDRIKQGDIIGYVGHTGDVKEPQLHFAVRDGNDAVDPMKYLKRNLASAE